MASDSALPDEPDELYSQLPVGGEPGPHCVSCCGTRWARVPSLDSGGSDGGVWICVSTAFCPGRRSNLV